jgi:mannose-6-phosphate isomerase-like protein (cupin superfamily)
MSRYKIVRAADVPDYTGGSPSPFLGYGRSLEAEQLGFNMRVLAPHTAHVPPDKDPSWGHSHSEIEEIYLVTEGQVAIKIDDEVQTLGPRDAVCLAPGAVRAVRNDGDEPAAVAMFSVKVDDPHAESQAHEGFWPAA